MKHVHKLLTRSQNALARSDPFDVCTQLGGITAGTCADPPSGTYATVTNGRGTGSIAADRGRLAWAKARGDQGSGIEPKSGSDGKVGRGDGVSVRADSFGSELVLGFVGPVGVANSRFHSAVMDRLRAFGYHPQPIRLSECLDELKAEGLLTTELRSEPEFERVYSHMDAGDELRGLDMPGARGLLAAAAVAKIASMRYKNQKGQTMPMPRYAWLISSLKNPAEVEVLRRVYGPRILSRRTFCHRGRAQEIARTRDDI
jgi:hypothetical protein